MQRTVMGGQCLQSKECWCLETGHEPQGGGVFLSKSDTAKRIGAFGQISRGRSGESCMRCASPFLGYGAAILKDMILVLFMFSVCSVSREVVRIVQRHSRKYTFQSQDVLSEITIWGWGSWRILYFADALNLLHEPQMYFLQVERIVRIELEWATILALHDPGKSEVIVSSV